MNRRWIELICLRPRFAFPIADIMLRLRSLLLGRGHPLHRNEGVRPFFIVGSGRCGTTLLRRILQASNQVHIPPETYVLGPAVMVYLRNRHRPWPVVVRSVLSLFEFHPEFDTFGVPLRPLGLHLIEAPKERRSLALILHRLFVYHGEQTGQRFERWGDKTPLNSFWLGAIRSVFPDARFIHLVRDGADVAASRLQAGFEEDIVRAAQRWKAAVRAVRRFAERHPEVCHEVRYEDLVSAPKEVVSRICSFLDLEFQPGMTEALGHSRDMGDVSRLAHHENVSKPISTSSIGRGRRGLSAKARSELQRVIGADLRRFGYDPLI
jgi:hypothetical protein